MNGIGRAWRAALSVGDGYEPQPAGQFWRSDTVGGYFVDLRQKTTSRAAARPSALQPAPLAQLALGAWERFLAGEEFDKRFFALCALLEDRAEPIGKELRWRYTVPVPKYGLSEAWYSAMAQGQIASVFVRAHLRTGLLKYAEIAMRAVEGLLRAASDLVTITDSGPVLEEAPSDPPSHILNGWIFALWGLWDVALGLRHAAAGDAFSAGIDCLRRNLHLYDAGWWTRYSLYPHRPADLAKPFYHRLHTVQVRVLYQMTEFPEFRDAERRWLSYDTHMRRGIAVVHKGLFIASPINRR